MKHDELAHVLRASAAISNETSFVLIGSQAVLLLLEQPPADLLVSTEIDLYPALHPEKADLIDGAIGANSTFHDTFGYYAQGVVESTARLPDGWRERLVRFDTPSTRGVTAWCLDLHDLWISKAVAGRDKDREFCRALMLRGDVEPAVLQARLALVPTLDDHIRANVMSWIPS